MKKRQIFEKGVEKSLIFFQKYSTYLLNYLNVKVNKYLLYLYEDVAEI